MSFSDPVFPICANVYVHARSLTNFRMICTNSTIITSDCGFLRIYGKVENKETHSIQKCI